MCEDPAANSALPERMANSFPVNAPALPMQHHDECARIKNEQNKHTSERLDSRFQIKPASSSSKWSHQKKNPPLSLHQISWNKFGPNMSVDIPKLNYLNMNPFDWYVCAFQVQVFGLKVSVATLLREPSSTHWTCIA